MRYHSGFLLIEVVAVTCLAAAMSAAALPPLSRHLETARENVLSYNVQVLQQTVEIFAVRKGRYPACLTELVEAGYLYSLPVNPRTGKSDFCYDPKSGKVGKEKSPSTHRY